MYRFLNIAIGYSELLLEEKELVFKPGECTVLIGDNGLGKTSLMRCLMGLEDPFGKDSIVRKGVDLSEMAYVGTQRPAVDFLTAKDYLIFGYSGILSEYSRSLLKQFELHIDLNVDLSTLSDGQYRRLAIIRQLQRKPKLLLLDEPSAHLDQKNKKLLAEVLNNLKSSTSILMSTHDFDFARMVEDNVISLEGKRLVKKSL